MKTQRSFEGSGANGGGVASKGSGGRLRYGLYALCAGAKVSFCQKSDEVAVSVSDVKSVK